MIRVTDRDLASLLTKTEMPTEQELRELTVLQRHEMRKVQVLSIKAARAEQEALTVKVTRMEQLKTAYRQAQLTSETTFTQGRARLKEYMDELYGANK